MEIAVIISLVLGGCLLLGMLLLMMQLKKQKQNLKMMEAKATKFSSVDAIQDCFHAMPQFGLLVQASSNLRGEMTDTREKLGSLNREFEYNKPFLNQVDVDLKREVKRVGDLEGKITADQTKFIELEKLVETLREQNTRINNILFNGHPGPQPSFPPLPPSINGPSQQQQQPYFQPPPQQFPLPLPYLSQQQQQQQQQPILSHPFSPPSAPPLPPSSSGLPYFPLRGEVGGNHHGATPHHDNHSDNRGSHGHVAGAGVSTDSSPPTTSMPQQQQQQQQQQQSLPFTTESSAYPRDFPQPPIIPDFAKDVAREDRILESGIESSNNKEQL